MAKWKLEVDIEVDTLSEAWEAALHLPADFRTVEIRDSQEYGITGFWITEVPVDGEKARRIGGQFSGAAASGQTVEAEPIREKFLVELSPEDRKLLTEIRDAILPLRWTANINPPTYPHWNTVNSNGQTPGVD